jgi:hypothetical protein
MLVYVLLGSDLSDSMVSSCSEVPCCAMVGWFNGKQQMADLVAHYKGLFPSALLEGFSLKTV